MKPIQIGDKTIESKKTVELLGVEVDFRLNFELDINNLCTKAGGQLNSLFRFEKFLSSDSKNLCVLIATYCPISATAPWWCGIFVKEYSIIKSKMSKKDLINYLMKTQKS